MCGCAKQHVRQCARNWRKKCAACKAVRQCARIGIGLWENVNRVARCSLPGQKSDSASMQPSGDCRQKSRLNKKIVACSPCAACHYLLPACLFKPKQETRSKLQLLLINIGSSNLDAIPDICQFRYTLAIRPVKSTPKQSKRAKIGQNIAFPMLKGTSPPFWLREGIKKIDFF